VAERVGKLDGFELVLVLVLVLLVLAIELGRDIGREMYGRGIGKRNMGGRRFII
jgi:hypothetical protein